MTKFENMTPETFDAAVRAEVEKQLSSREEAEARREAEEAIREARETFDTLKASIEAKDAKIKEYEDSLANLDLDPTAAEVAANDKIVELEAAVETWKHRAEVAEAALETLSREEIAAGRMSELDEAGVALEEEAAEAQYAKIRGMSDEDFASYKSELVALRAKYAPASDEAGEEEEGAELAAEEISMIAQSLGCDPSDEKCISLVREVAVKMSEVSKSRKMKNLPPWLMKKKEEKSEEVPVVEKLVKETASVKLSLGDAITKSMDQEIQAPASLKEELAQAWEGYHASKRGSKKSD